MSEISDAPEVRRAHRTELSPFSFSGAPLVCPEKTAIVHGDRRYNYRQFEERVNRLASGLLAAGLRREDRVAFLCPIFRRCWKRTLPFPPPEASWCRLTPD